jgi:hypothetical protein
MDVKIRVWKSSLERYFVQSKLSLLGPLGIEESKAHFSLTSKTCPGTGDSFHERQVASF